MTNGIVEVGDVANVTNFNVDQTGAGTDLVVQHPGFQSGFYFFRSSAPGTLNFTAAATGQYAIGITASNSLNSAAGPYTVTLSGNTANVSAVPEPSSLVLLGIGAVCLVGYRRKRRRAHVADGDSQEV